MPCDVSTGGSSDRERAETCRSVPPRTEARGRDAATLPRRSDEDPRCRCGRHRRAAMCHRIPGARMSNRGTVRGPGTDLGAYRRAACGGRAALAGEPTSPASQGTGGRVVLMPHPWAPVPGWVLARLRTMPGSVFANRNAHASNHGALTQNCQNLLVFDER